MLIARRVVKALLFRSSTAAMVLIDVPELSQSSVEKNTK